MLGRRVSRTRWTHLACPMSLTAGVQDLLISECPTASLSPGSSRWVTRYRHAPPEVVVPCQHLQFVRNQLLQFGLGTPGSVSQLVKWHSATQIAFDETPPWTDELPISYELFTDGSSVFLESSRNGAAAVVLIVNTISGPRFGGTHCFHVDAPATAPRAEIVAMLGAVLWAVELAGRHPSATPHFRFGFDNTLACNAAAGHWSPSCHLDIQTCIRSLCHWMQARFGDDVFEWAHVKAHSGHPWNEAADALSWAAVAQWIPVQPLLERLPDLLLVEKHPGTHEWLWLLEYALQHRPGAPRVDSLGFHFRLDHPFEQQPHAREHPLLPVAGPRTAHSLYLYAPLQHCQRSYIAIWRPWSPSRTLGQSISAGWGALHWIARDTLPSLRTPFLRWISCTLSTLCQRGWWGPILDSSYMVYWAGHFANPTLRLADPGFYISANGGVPTTSRSPSTVYCVPRAIWRQSCYIWWLLASDLSLHPRGLQGLETDLPGRRERQGRRKHLDLHWRIWRGGGKLGRKPLPPMADHSVASGPANLWSSSSRSTLYVDSCQWYSQSPAWLHFGWFGALFYRDTYLGVPRHRPISGSGWSWVCLHWHPC